MLRLRALVALTAALAPALSLAQANPHAVDRDVPAGAGRTSASALTEAEAHDLIFSTFLPAARRFPGRTFEAMPAVPRPAGFWVWEAQADPGPDVSPVLGHFAVNQRTGDVWDLSDCHRARSTAIARMRRRQRMRLGGATFRRFSAVAPCRG